MCRVFTIVLVAASVLYARGAAAQSVAEPKTVTVTPFVGVTFGLSDDLADRLGIDFGSSLVLGGAIAYDLTSNVGFEFELGRVFDVSGDNEFVDTSVTTISGNFVYHFDVKRVTPYATVGLGWEYVSVDLDDVNDDPDDAETDTEIAWNFGGGVKVPLTSRVLLRGDLRRFQGNDLAPDHWRVYGGVTFWIKR